MSCAKETTLALFVMYLSPPLTFSFFVLDFITTGA